MALNEGMTYRWEPEQRETYAQKSMVFIDRITDTLSKKMVRKVKNRSGDKIWPWDRKRLTTQGQHIPLVKTDSLMGQRGYPGGLANL
jgi:hypothetical protein